MNRRKTRLLSVLIAGFLILSQVSGTLPSFATISAGATDVDLSTWTDSAVAAIGWDGDTLTPANQTVTTLVYQRFGAVLSSTLDHASMFNGRAYSGSSGNWVLSTNVDFRYDFRIKNSVHVYIPPEYKHSATGGKYTFEYYKENIGKTSQDAKTCGVKISRRETCTKAEEPTLDDYSDIDYYVSVDASADDDLWLVTYHSVDINPMGTRNYAQFSASDRWEFIPITSSEPMLIHNRASVVVQRDVVENWKILIARARQTPVSSFETSELDKTAYAGSFKLGFETDSDGEVTYSSSNLSVAAVSNTGLLSIYGVGSAIITAETKETAKYNASSTTMTINVTKATPELSNVSASAIEFGQSLAESTIVGTARVGSLDVPGKWTWTDSSITSSAAGTFAYSYVFTPDDTDNINIVTGNSVDVEVVQKTGYLQGVTASGITYGQSLNDVILQHSDGIDGEFIFDTPDVKPNAGSYVASWTFTPRNPNYAIETGTVNVLVSASTPKVKSVSAVNTLVYGDRLGSAGISGVVLGIDDIKLNGVWSFQLDNAYPTVADSNSTEYTVIFTPDDKNYASITGTVKVQVNPATLSKRDFSFSIPDFVYGDNLGKVTPIISNQPVSGSFAWSEPDLIPSVSDSNSTYYALKFIPDSPNYAPVNFDVTVVVKKASSDITSDIKASLVASDISYGQTLGDSSISGSTPHPGHFEWVNPSIKPSVDNSDVVEFDVVFIPDDEVNYSRSNTTLSLTVKKATPIFTQDMLNSIRASDIVYGDTLSSSIISGNTPIMGTLSWDDSGIIPDVDDSNVTRYGIIFTPADTVNYETVAGLSTTVHVNKATPVVTSEMEATIQATTITYNQTLADSQLSGTTPIPGHYEWVDNTITPSVADSGVTEYAVRFIPDDTDNNNTVEGITCKLIVNKATPDVNSSVLATISASDITYGDSLADSGITGDLPVNSKGDEVAGSYVWADSSIKPSVSDSELSLYTVIFTPADTDNYTTATFTLTLKVNKADITIPSDIGATITASDIVYEQSLADSTLSGTMSDVNGTTITGHYEWVDSSIQPSVADSGVTNYEVVFKPDDSINYNDVTGLYTTLTIAKLTPSIEPDVIATLSASGITYGQTLGDSVISGNTPRPGHWKWVNADATPSVADSNVTGFEIIWIPDDTDNYNPATALLKLKVNKAKPAVNSSVITVGDIVWGTCLGDASLTGNYPTLNGSAITGNYSWINPDAILDAGDQPARVLFTPDDFNNFTTAEVEVVIHINPLVPILTPEIRSTIKASDITYGQTLASAILSGDVPVAGHYAWKFPDTLPTVADSNLTAFDVVFIPDSSNYATVDLKCTVVVNKKVIAISDDIKNTISIGNITYGQLLDDATITGAVPVPGHYIWKDGGITPRVDDENNYEVIFMPDEPNYAPVSIGVKPVTVNKAIPVLDISKVNATDIVYGNNLGTSVITSSDNVSGMFSWANPSIIPALTDSNSTEFDVMFTPADSINYEVVNLRLKVRVIQHKIVLPDNIADLLTASAIKFGQSLSDSSIAFDAHNSSLPAGHFEWVDPSIKPAMSDSDITKYSVRFIPNDMSYSSADTELTIHVDKADLPTEYLNLTDTVALKPGASATYNISNKFRLPEASVTGITKTDAHNVLEKADLTGNAVDLTAIASSAVEGHSAEIVFTISSRDYVDATLTLTVVVTACDHSGDTHIVGYRAPTNDTPGYTGDVVCNICGATIEFGHEIPAIQDTCEHAHTHIENAVAADCVTDGYTGDVVCDNCNKVITQGTVIPKTGHLHTHIEGYKEATCKEVGYTGDKYCDDCGAAIEKGTVVPKLAHIEGDAVVIKEATRTETGLKAWYCILCNTQLRTEVIPKLGGPVYPPRPRPEEPDEPTEETEESEEVTSETEESEEVTSETEESEEVTSETEESEEVTSETEESEEVTSETEESEEIISEIDPNTWDVDSSNPHTGAKRALLSICLAGASSVIALVAILLSRKKRK